MKIWEICDINKANVHYRKDEDVNYLDTGSLTEGVIASLLHIPFGKAPSRAQRAVQKNTILYSTVRPNQLHFGIVTAPVHNMVVSTGFATLDIKEDKVQEIDPFYLYYKLTQDDITRHLHTVAEGSVTSYPSISPEDIGDLDFDFPRIEEQRRIGSILHNIDKKIALNRAISLQMEELARNVFDYWFTQFDFPDESGNPYKTSGGEMVYNVNLKREIPKLWDDGILSDIANITMGQSPDGKSYNDAGDGILFYQGSTDFGERFPSVRQYTTMPSRFASKGDILMSVRAPVGALNIANNDCCIGRGLASLNSKLGSITHLYYVMSSFREMFARLSDVGTTFGSITKDELHELPVVKPDPKVVELFEKRCKPIFDQQMVLGEEIVYLSHLRTELLPLLMNGQIIVD